MCNVPNKKEVEHMLIKSLQCIKHIQPNSGLTAGKMFLALSKRNRLKIQLVSKKYISTQQKNTTEKCTKLNILNCHWKN